MKHDPEHIHTLAQKTAESLTQGAWPAFLRTAAWNFKYDFTSQLLIFAQKPDATACAPYDLWTSAPFHRRPMKGRAIALLDDSSPNPGLRYVFDISDTVLKKGASDPTDPVWEVTPQKEHTVRRALAEAFLPYEQQTELHLASDPSDFYRSIAFSIVRTHYEEFFQDVMEIETERTIRNLLTESVSAMLQFRCGLIPAVNDEVLDQIRNFHDIGTASAIGQATQSMARIGLLEASHAVHAWDVQHKGHASTANREERASEAGLGISEEDITRALTAGPPLEHGKFRLQQAAGDPKLTSEQLADTLRKEYGTGHRPFLLVNGIHGTLSWGPEGLKIERNGLRECVHLTLDWKIASERLKRLVGADLYLSRAEKHNMLGWQTAQTALWDRKKEGAALSALLNTLIPSHPNLHVYQEQVRAYIYENSETTRRQLANALRDVSTLDQIQNDPSARSALATLLKTISDPLTAEQNTGTVVPAEGKGGPGTVTPENKANAHSLPRKNSNQDLSLLCAATARKEIHFADKPDPKTVDTDPLTSIFPPETSQFDRSSEKKVPRPKEPLIDHPELCQKELHRLERGDKVALTDLLYHYITYRYTFQSHTPELCAHDAASREEQLATLDAILVSPSVEENLENIRKAKTTLTRWFLPFEGIRPDILTEQERLIDAAEQILSEPPKQDEEYAYNHPYDYNYKDIEPIAPVEIEEDVANTIWAYEGERERQIYRPLSDRIQNAHARSSTASVTSTRDLLELGK